MNGPNAPRFDMRLGAQSDMRLALTTRCHLHIKRAPCPGEPIDATVQQRAAPGSCRSSPYSRDEGAALLAQRDTWMSREGRWLATAALSARPGSRGETTGNRRTGWSRREPSGVARRNTTTTKDHKELQRTIKDHKDTQRTIKNHKESRRTSNNHRKPHRATEKSHGTGTVASHKQVSSNSMGLHNPHGPIAYEELKGTITAEEPRESQRTAILLKEERKDSNR